MKHPTNRMKSWIEGKEVEDKFLIQIYDFFYHNKAMYYSMRSSFFNKSISILDFIDQFNVSNSIGYGVYSIFKNTDRNDQLTNLDQFVLTDCKDIKNVRYLKRKIKPSYKPYSRKEEVNQ